MSDVDSKLRIAAILGDIGGIIRLKSEGANVNARDEFGQIPLMHAVWFNHLQVVEFLVRNGADVSERNNLGQTARDYASENRHAEVAAALDLFASKQEATMTEALSRMRYSIARLKRGISAEKRIAH